MKKIILCWLLSYIIGFSYAQTVTIRDIETGEALEQATLVSKHPEAYTTTNQKGQTDISAFKDAGKIEIQMLGYKTETLSFAEIEKKGFNIFMILTGVSLNEVVISASKFEERQDDVAQKIEVVRKSELQNMNQTSTADVISNSGNIMVQKSQGGGGSPIIRGFETNKVLMVVDGVRMNNAIYRGGHLQNIVTLDNSIMERVELVYGPGSVVYGSDALGGVMHFYTRNPTLSAGDSMVVYANAYTRSFSSARGYAAHADVSLGGQKFGSLTSLTYSDYGDSRQGTVRNPFYNSFGVRPWYVESIDGVDSMLVNADSNLQVGSGYTQYDVLQKFMYKQSEKMKHVLNFQFSNSSDIPRYDRLTQLSDSKPKYGEWYYGPQKRFFASYNMILDNDSGIYEHGRIIIGYQNIEESRNTRRFRSVYLNHQNEQLNILSLNADFDKTVARNEIRYGIEAYYNQVSSTAFMEDIKMDTTTKSYSRYPDGGSTMSAIALYGTHTWEISEKLILTDGLRITNVMLKSEFIDKTFFPFPYNTIYQNSTAASGNLGLIFKQSDSWRISGNLSSGFRAPNVDDMSKVFESVPGSIIIPNPDLKPEYTYNGELGVMNTFDKRVSASLFGYYTIYKDALTVQPSLYEGQDSILYDGQMSRVTSTVNAGEAYIYGLEGRMAGNFNEYLSIVGTINYTYGRIKTDTADYPLDHIPPVFGKISFNVVKNKLRSEVFVNYSAWKRLEDYNLVGEDNIESATSEGMPEWYTLNMRFTYHILKNISIQTACENIFDRNYRVFASNISAPGRNFIVTIRGSF